MSPILFFLIPTLAGAIIGYLTNYVAIKMLFRPLKEIRIFGLRLPFTPGILPKERHKLADSIGRMVENELITPGVLKERLTRADIHEKTEKAVSVYSDKLLEKELSEILFASDFDDIPIAGFLTDFFNSDIFISFLDEILNELLLKENDSPKDESNVLSWIKSRVKDIGEYLIPAARDMIKTSLIREMKNQAQGKNSSYKMALIKITEKYPGITLREFLSLREHKKNILDLYIAGKAISTINDNAENVLSSVNVKLLVSDRVNSLDMSRVEKIILDVMAGQLKWINVFGAILGALIGALQVGLNLLLRQ